jgi:hypothetical protein
MTPLQESITELRQQEKFYDELWKKYRRDTYLAMATAYKIAARIVDRSGK